MSDNLEKCANYLRIIRLIVDVGTDSVRELFYCYKPKEKVEEFFASETIFNELFDLKKKHVITNEQFDKLTCDPNPDEFDISLLITILVNLFKWTVEEPKNGWDKPVSVDDTSLGACLLRLRKLRNSLVGHSADAKLSTDEFEELWRQAENHLRQIAKVTKNDRIGEVIQVYRSSPLDCNGNNGDKYIELLRHWYEEGVSALENLQGEVEDLCKKTEEYALFFKSSIPDRYKRYVLLLFEGGLLVLADILKRELMRKKTDLASVLSSHENLPFLQSLPIPMHTNGTFTTDVSKWGLKTLSDLVLHIFHNNLNPMERKAISDIGSAYADYANVAIYSLDSDKFRPYWTDIVSNMYILAAGLNEETQRTCKELIRKHDMEPINEFAVNIYLLQLRQHCTPVQSLVHQYLDTRQKLKHAVEQMEREGVCFRDKQVIELKMMIYGKTEEKQRLAENILYTVWKKAVTLSEGSEDFGVIKQNVEDILEGIKSIPNVKVTKVEKQCIIVTIECSSHTGLLELVEFIDSQPFECCVHGFGQILTEYCGDPIIVTAFITIDSILETMKSLGYSGSDIPPSSIGIKVSCDSTLARLDVQQFVASGETANNVNKIAQDLSENLNEKISLETTLDMGGLSDIYEWMPLHRFSKSKWMPFMLPRLEEKEFHLPFCQYLNSILTDLKERTKSFSKDQAFGRASLIFSSSETVEKEPIELEDNVDSPIKPRKSIFSKVKKRLKKAFAGKPKKQRNEQKSSNENLNYLEEPSTSTGKLGISQRTIRSNSEPAISHSNSQYLVPLYASSGGTCLDEITTKHSEIERAITNSSSSSRTSLSSDADLECKKELVRNARRNKMFRSRSDTNNPTVSHEIDNVSINSDRGSLASFGSAVSRMSERSFG